MFFFEGALLGIGLKRNLRTPPIAFCSFCSFFVLGGGVGVGGGRWGAILTNIHFGFSLNLVPCSHCSKMGPVRYVRNPIPKSESLRGMDKTRFAPVESCIPVLKGFPSIPTGAKQILPMSNGWKLPGFGFTLIQEPRVATTLPICFSFSASTPEA